MSRRLSRSIGVVAAPNTNRLPSGDHDGAPCTVYVVPSVMRVACLVVHVDDPRVREPEVALEHALVIALLDVGFFLGAARVGGDKRDPRCRPAPTNTS